MTAIVTASPIVVAIVAYSGGMTGGTGAGGGTVAGGEIGVGGETASSS